MGTSALVQVAGLDDPAPALDAAFSALERIDTALSLWHPSELTRLNDTARAEASPDLQAVLHRALDVARDSGGAFDPTVEPLVRATGGVGGPRRRLGSGERNRLLARVGFDRVRLDPHRGTVTLAPGTRLDLGGIAKGYAADLALEALRAAGARAGLVDLGASSISVFGEPLRLDVRDPERGERAPPWASFEVTDRAVSTSGGDQQAGHILDPRSGHPARQVLAATVVARTGIEADALSTAVYVLGARDGLALLERRGAAGFVLLRDGRERVLRATRNFGSTWRLTTRPEVRVRP